MATDADNPTLLQVLVLERVDRAKNMARFYVLSIEPTLLRIWRLCAGGAALSISARSNELEFEKRFDVFLTGYQSDLSSVVV